jgi:hypothetical protein
MNDTTTTTTDFDMIPGEQIVVEMDADGMYLITRYTPNEDSYDGSEIVQWSHVEPTFTIGRFADS